MKMVPSACKVASLVGQGIPACVTKRNLEVEQHVPNNFRVTQRSCFPRNGLEIVVKGFASDVYPVEERYFFTQVFGKV